MPQHLLMEVVMTADVAASPLPPPPSAGAKPVLRSGDKFPCITLHYLPSLQPVQTLAGSGAVEALQAALREHAATAAVAPAAAAAAGAGPAPAGRLVALKKGAAEYKEALAAARDAGVPAVVVWTRGDSGSGAAALRAAGAQAAAATPGLVVVDADAGASPANQVLAGALKVACPEVHVYRDMKLASKLAGAQVTPAALVALLARLAPGSSSNGISASATAAPAAVPTASPAAAAAAATPTAAAASSSNGSSGVFDPPGGKFAKPGATKRFPDGRMGYFFPKMPCLRWAPVG